jgi:hypothetical protein
MHEDKVKGKGIEKLRKIFIKLSIGFDGMRRKNLKSHG